MDKRLYLAGGKRLFDCTASGAAIIVLLPLLLGIALVIVVTNGGPPIIVQDRVGRNGQLFRFLKFRSMRVTPNTAAIDTRATQLAASGKLLKIDHDPRVTPAGRILRAYSLDELPQLFNVLLGDMSLVGPRPLLPFMVEPYPDENRQRASVRPGLTGLWQISARSESSSVLQMIDWDVRYIHELSLATDLRILRKTLPQVLRARGAK